MTGPIDFDYETLLELSLVFINEEVIEYFLDPNVF